MKRRQGQECVGIPRVLGGRSSRLGPRQKRTCGLERGKLAAKAVTDIQVKGFKKRKKK